MEDVSNINIWRLQLNTATENIGKHCIDNNLAAIGWSLLNLTDDDRESIETFSDYEKMAAKQGYGSYDSVKRFAREVKENDIFWMHYAGKYYLARVTAESKWCFDNAYKDLDACNEITNIHWIKAGEHGDEIDVPGIITTAFFMGSAFQRINKAGVREYSKYLYNRLATDDYKYELEKMETSCKTFFNMLQPDDAEDLLYSWLYAKHEYICIPSSNKKSTQTYEFVMLDPKSEARKHIYMQVKKGEIDLDALDYEHLDGDVYLLTTEGYVKNLDLVKNNNIFAVNPEELYLFAFDENNNNIISESISNWIDFLKSC